MKILILGDVMGLSGRKVLKQNLTSIIKNNEIPKTALLEKYKAQLIWGIVLKNKYKERNWLKYYYTLKNILNINIKLINPILLNWINGLLNKLEPVNNFQLYQDFFKNIKDNIENNSALLKFKNVELYQHQKELFSIFNKQNSEKKHKLVFYIAPTGTGKTITPIGLSQKYKIIFVCAARHVGLQLAKSLII